MPDARETSAARPDPGRVFELATGYWQSAAFLAASGVGLFDALADGAATPTA